MPQTTNFVKDKHNTLFKTLIDKLRSDIGYTITVHNRATGTDCAWCESDPMTGKSLGIPSAGYTWSDHDDYAGETVCPNCWGEGSTGVSSTTDVNNVIVEDISGMIYDRDKGFAFPMGTKKITGKLTDILSDSADVNSKTIFEAARKVVIEGEDFRVKSVNRIGIKDRYLFEAIMERTDVVDVPAT